MVHKNNVDIEMDGKNLKYFEFTMLYVKKNFHISDRIIIFMAFKKVIIIYG